MWVHGVWVHRDSLLEPKVLCPNSKFVFFVTCIVLNLEYLGNTGSQK